MLPAILLLKLERRVLHCTKWGDICLSLFLNCLSRVLICWRYSSVGVAAVERIWLQSLVIVKLSVLNVLNFISFLTIVVCTIALLQKITYIWPSLGMKLKIVFRNVKFISNHKFRWHKLSSHFELSNFLHLISGLSKLDHNYSSKCMPKMDSEYPQTGGESPYKFLRSISSKGLFLQ